MSASQGKESDFIIVGAGIAGTVLASRLSQKDPALSILLIEAGSDSTKRPLAETASLATSAPSLRDSEFDWSYLTVLQKNLDGRQIYGGSRKGLGGGLIINYGVWTRGDAKDYEDWAMLVGDRRWAWDGFLPYFRKIESCHGPNADENLDTVKVVWTSLGVKEIPDGNGGDQLGIAEEVENRTANKRTIAASAYPLDEVIVLSETLVKRVIMSPEKVATGVELADGRAFYAKREVIISTGSFRTLQLLMLSTIGPAAELNRHGINQIVELPDVGKNLWNHLATLQAQKLRHPEIGAAYGSTQRTDPRLQMAILWIGERINQYPLMSRRRPCHLTTLEE